MRHPGQCYHPGLPDARRTPVATRPSHEVRTLATEQEIARFLAEVERRAFRHAMFALRDEHLALDLVQESMLRLTEKYSDKPPEELPLLFHRILQNTIRDHYRRQKVRNLWTTLLSSLSPDDDEESDPLDRIRVEDSEGSPEDQAERAQIAALVGEAVQRLPKRQQEAFLLRYWEEFDVAETAQAMGCSEGSVKTHCSRATHTIAAYLRRRGITTP